MSNVFNVKYSSDPGHEEIVIEIDYNRATVAIIDKDKGVDNLDISIFPPPHGGASWKFPLDNFLQVLQLSAKKLKE